MPFGQSPHDKRISDLVYDGIIRPALKKAGVYPVRIDRDHRTDDLIQPAVLNKLNSAPVVVADVSWNNPNVVFELGYRKALGKSFVILSMTPDDAAWWLKGYPMIDATLPNATARITKAVKQAVSQSSQVCELRAQLIQISNELGELSEGNPFIDRVAAWRVGRAKTEVNQINERSISYKAQSSTDYVGYNFSALMKILRPGETYYTVSRINFWSDKGVEESPFLEENKHAANRDVSINRVIIVDRHELKNNLSAKSGTIYDVLKRHLVEKVSSDKCMKNMTIKVLPVDNVDVEIKRYGHFGLLTSTAEQDLENAFALLVSPIRGESLLEGIELHFTEGRCRDDHVVQSVINKLRLALHHSNARDIREIIET